MTLITFPIRPLPAGERACEQKTPEDRPHHNSLRRSLQLVPSGTPPPPPPFTGSQRARFGSEGESEGFGRARLDGLQPANYQTTLQGVQGTMIQGKKRARDGDEGLEELASPLQKPRFTVDLTLDDDQCL